MKKICLYVSALFLGGLPSQATPLFSDDFNSYANGGLVGQGPWLQTGTATATPIQVTGNQAVLGTSGQDAYAAFPGGAITLTDGTSLYAGLTLDVTAAQAAGDYFLHFTPTVANTSLFPDRLFAKSSGTGFVLGWVETTGGGGLPTYGTTVLSFGTSYKIVLAYNDVSGTLNDTGVIYVNPTDVSIEANNTPYLTKTWTSTLAESEAFAAINFRQGTASSAPSVIVDDLNASQTFSEVATFTPVPIPEPNALALVTGGLALLALRFRRRNV